VSQPYGTSWLVTAIALPYRLYRNLFKNLRKNHKHMRRVSAPASIGTEASPLQPLTQLQDYEDGTEIGSATTVAGIFEFLNVTETSRI
jgi:hypothetical protein